MRRAGIAFPNGLHGLSAKTMLALAAAALPALLVATILGFTLVTAVTQAERDFESSTAAARRLTDIRVLLERERGLVSRIPAELDLKNVARYASEAQEARQRLDVAIASLAANARTVAPDVVSEIRAVRQKMAQAADRVGEAANSFAQTSALEIVNGPFEEASTLLIVFLDAIGANVENVAEQARVRLQASSLRAWQLAPVALVGAVCMVAFGVWLTRREILVPILALDRHVAHIRKSGNLDIRPERRILDRNDELGTLCGSFESMVGELAAARRELIARSEAEIAKYGQRLEAALTNMLQGLAMFDAEQRLVLCNDRYATMYGLGPEQVKPGTTLRQILECRIANGDLTTSPVDDTLRLVLSRAPRGSTGGSYVSRLNDGRWIAVAVEPMADGGTVTTHEDITERRLAENRIAHMARHDALTDLPNRVLLRERLEQALTGDRIGDRHPTVLMLDLDRFKEVNDTLGHPAGDTLLTTVAERLRGCVRKADTVARLGGDEFAIIQFADDQAGEAEALSKRILDVLSEPYDLGGHQAVIGTSIGIAVAPDDGSDPDTLMKNADLALYRSKSEGRGTFRFFAPEMDERMQARRRLEQDLRNALVRHEFALHYQPLVNLERNEICGFEALLRWAHPERGELLPGDFIPLAEETGLIVPIGEWVLREACLEAGAWPEHLKIAVNLSPAQFKSPNLVQAVLNAVAGAAMPANRLELEITESVMLQDEAAAFAILHQLHDLGVRIALDDFGTGYSSLSNLRKFPFDKIKIDRSFVSDLSEADVDAVAVVRSVAQLGVSLGMATTAEGVETEDQLERVRAEGCTEIQGYYICPPSPAKEIARRFFAERSLAVPAKAGHAA
jgi:diguanylate cyclase (GGDEF)-like protein